jgi:hypothetical protein
MNNSEEIEPAFKLKKNSLSYYTPIHKTIAANKQPIRLENIVSDETNINLKKIYNMFGTNFTSKDLNIQSLIDSGLKLSKIQKILGQIDLIWFYNFDINAIRKFLQTIVKGNISRFLKDYENLINYVKLNDIKENNKIELFLERLKNAS